MRLFFIFIFLFLTFNFIWGQFLDTEITLNDYGFDHISQDTVKFITTDYLLGAESYEKYRAETTIKYLLKFYDEYKQECYADSFKVQTILEDGFNSKWITTWEHRKPTEFMEWLNKKIGENK